MVLTSTHESQMPETPGQQGLSGESTAVQAGTDSSFLHHPPSNKLNDLSDNELHILATFADTLQE
jgi:hypothetical protein